ncbi:FAD-binding protein [Candidatus Sumerlaeota bacterium]|nr:FAD-binding protein [Candidatus Sumerlaeota bacterium]
MPVTDAVKSELRRIVSDRGFRDEPEDLITHAYDGTPLLEHRPEAIVIPQSTEQVAAIVRLANDADFKIVPRGAGSGLSGGSVPVDNSVVVLLSPRREILEIDEANLTALVEPGVVTGTLADAVAARDLFYPPDPGSISICTLGGNVAEDSGGLRGLKYGVTHNYVMGLEVVTPTGEVLTTGGKAFKNVAGYRLHDVLVGSEGTLGIFTKILLRLLPRPQASQGVVAHFACLEEAATAVAGIIAAKITPAMMEFLDQTTIRCVEDFAKIGLPRDIGALLLMESDGHPAVVAEEAAQMEAICRRAGALHVAQAADPAEGERMKTARRSAFAALARLKPTTILEDATVPRSALPEMVARVEEVARRHGILLGTFGHAGDGNLHPTLCTDERDHEEIHRVETAFAEIFDIAIELGGTITGEHGVGLSKKPFLEKLVGPPGIRMMQDLKQVMDPRAVLNPGKIIEPRPRREGRLPNTQAEAEAMARSMMERP